VRLSAHTSAFKSGTGQFDDKMTIEPNLRRMNSFVLQKQKLIDDRPGEDIVQIVKDIGGLHATSPTTPYLSLFARVKNFEREHLDTELYEKRNARQMIKCLKYLERNLKGISLME